VYSALSKVRDSPSQEKTPENVLVINYILNHPHAQHHKSEMSAIASYAVLWKDTDIWKRVVEKVNDNKERSYDSGPFKVLGKENVLKACSTFDFNEIQTMYVMSPRQHFLTSSHSIRLTTILDSDVTFRNQVDIIKLLQTRSSDENVTKWCSERVTKILTSLQKMKLSKDDAPALLAIIANRGLAALAVLTDVSVHFVTTFSFRRLTTFH